MTFNELQREVGAFDRRFGWTNDDPEHIVLHMQEEVGEISRNMLKKLKYKRGEYDPEKMNDEISDLLYLALKLGNLLNLDIDEGWGRIGERYRTK